MPRKPFGSVELAQQISSARESAGLSQAAMAETIGVHVQSVSRWERGTRVPDALHLRAIAIACRADARDLLGLR